jgi:hypothetical protein
MQHNFVRNVQQEEQVKLLKSALQKQTPLHINLIHKQEDRDIQQEDKRDVAALKRAPFITVVRPAEGKGPHREIREGLQAHNEKV